MDIGTGIAASAGVMTLGGLVLKFFNKDKTPGTKIIALQTGEVVDKKLDKFKTQVCIPTQQVFKKTDEDLKADLKEIKDEQVSHGKLLIKIHTTMKLVAKREDLKS